MFISLKLYLRFTLKIKRRGEIMKFEKPVIAEVIEEMNNNANSGRETCDTYDWSGCCFNG